MAITFTSLSAEIRNKIYACSLADSQITALTRRNGKITTHPHRDCKTSPLKNRINANLLRANTTINQEATPILYGNHLFLLRSGEQFLDWVIQIGFRNARMVRMLRLEYTSMCCGSFLGVLGSCMPNLTRLEIPFSTLWGPGELASLLGRLVTSRDVFEDTVASEMKMAKGEKGSGSQRARKVAEMLEFYTQDDVRRKCIMSTDERARVYGEKVKKEILRIARGMQRL